MIGREGRGGVLLVALLVANVSSIGGCADGAGCRGGLFRSLFLGGVTSSFFSSCCSASGLSRGE